MTLGWCLACPCPGPCMSTFEWWHMLPHTAPRPRDPPKSQCHSLLCLGLGMGAVHSVLPSPYACCPVRGAPRVLSEQSPVDHHLASSVNLVLLHLMTPSPLTQNALPAAISSPEAPYHTFYTYTRYASGTRSLLGSQLNTHPTMINSATGLVPSVPLTPPPSSGPLEGRW